jgi:hypothetical protein
MCGSLQHKARSFSQQSAGGTAAAPRASRSLRIERAWSCRIDSSPWCLAVMPATAYTPSSRQPDLVHPFIEPFLKGKRRNQCSTQPHDEPTPSFTPAALRFFRQLEENNNKPWFEARRVFLEDRVHNTGREDQPRAMDDLSVSQSISQTRLRNANSGRSHHHGVFLSGLSRT